LDFIYKNIDREKRREEIPNLQRIEMQKNDNIVEINLMGGLGNQLFQIATAYAYATDHGYTLKLPDARKLTIGRSRPTYWNTPLLSRFGACHVDAYNKPITHSIIESSFHYTPLNDRLVVTNSVTQSAVTQSAVTQSADRIRLFGYFPTWRYFDHIYDAILRDMIPVSELRDGICQKFKTAMKEEDGCVVVSMHFRRGDYLALPDIHPVLPVSYYQEALRQIFAHPDMTNVCIRYFCEDGDIDDVMHMIRQLQGGVEFSGKNVSFVRAPSAEDWEQLIMMSMCDFNIIANSSFSWWGAYLQEKHRGQTNRVFYPDRWFGKKLDKKMHDLCLPDWVCIPVV
jgi:hypothetical protein